MVSIAISNLFHQKSKSILSISGVILSVFLVFTIYGVYNGMDYIMESMTYKTGADLWITQQGTSGSVHSPSFIPVDIGDQLSEYDEIEEFTPIIRTALTYKVGSTDILIFINGYNTSGNLGNPWKVIEGKINPGEKEIIIDQTFSKISGLIIGDNISIQSSTFRIVGISDEGNIMVGYLAFLSYDDAKNLVPPNLTNGFIMKLKDGINSDEFSKKIQEDIPEINVQNSFSIAQAYKKEVLGGFIPIIFVLSAFSLFIGILINGLLIYMLTLEKSKEYGIIKAMGASNFKLYRIVLSQALIISVIGYVIGSILSFPLTSLIQEIVPEFYVKISTEMLIGGFPIFVMTGIIASLIPVSRLIGIDPAEVFK
ncbi:ABC transporter permease [Candidatus Lokiarchaeum ossiferum]|uniref:ABC transporter permease n=1 Tax=Candidatus Lokiarchaeum ossiferum TaxID=2951803 RepID=UPI00352F8ED1